MLVQEIIRRKRDGLTLSSDELTALANGIADGSVSEGQVAAFAMAVCFRGMAIEETAALTRAMTATGRVLDWTGCDVPGPLLDKHSTGGVGDKVSLILAPALAACGAFVPMISGRGLGHTGGTLDKLEAIPGYRTAVDVETLQKVVGATGCAIVGAGDDLAPADRRLYAVRDVTATVESVPLITASILSKKLAAGLAALTLDVKTGSGAFAATRTQAYELAASLIAVAEAIALPTVALVTDMNRVLGRSAGNALETTEALRCLRGEETDARLRELVCELGAAALLAAGSVADHAVGRAHLRRALDDGTAAERFGAMVAALGGPADLLEKHAAYLPQADVRHEVAPPRAGTVTTIDVRALGLAVVELGGGRRRPGDAVDPAVGLSDVCTPGDRVSAERPLAVVHARTHADAAGAAAAVRAAFTIGDAAPVPRPVIYERLYTDPVAEPSALG